MAKTLEWPGLSRWLKRYRLNLGEGACVLCIRPSRMTEYKAGQTIPAYTHQHIRFISALSNHARRGLIRRRLAFFESPFMTAKEFQKWRDFYELDVGSCASLLNISVSKCSEYYNDRRQVPPYIAAEMVAFDELDETTQETFINRGQRQLAKAS